MIAELLPRGKENAISTAKLCRAVGDVSVRKLRKMVAEERKAGSIILTSKNGYFIPSDINEVEEFLRTLDSKARSIMVALQSARKLLKNTVNENQIEIHS